MEGGKELGIDMDVTYLRITVDGSSINNGYDDAKAGWGAIITQDGEQIAHAFRALCKNCDRGKQTNNRAELRAAQFALHLLHEVAKLGRPYCVESSHERRRSRKRLQLSGIRDERRLMFSDKFHASLRSDSSFVVNGLKGLNRHRVHSDLWKEMSSCLRCLVNHDMKIDIEKVKAHSGDMENERADELARNAADLHHGEGLTWVCTVCDQSSNDGDAESLATHIKACSLKRNLEVENHANDAMLMDEDGMFSCSKGECPKRFSSRFALEQHIQAKHQQEDWPDNIF